MIIRSTAKLLNIARIPPIKYEEPVSLPFPGEWYAMLLSTGRRGSTAIHFLHNPTMISIIVLGKSLNKVLPLLPGRVISLLERNKVDGLIPAYDLDSSPTIYTTNSRSILATMNQFKFNIEYHLSASKDLTTADIKNIEDLQLNMLIGGKIGKGSYVTPLELLNTSRVDETQHD